ncbi:uncharacterized protein EV422DRAFT_288613 [Fimicolochytrium jonesii]|uniref:uncharacterized protein n=1 Tax=Fimicolochytrium jonesii TaxID=1396493 RepID=UPI0022FE4D3A|nr:uncharacterized protein EV422DRAFT_288613 [Fimicolochytrium jonesii]KAI8816547.1 hypothetical protein EV422DRAFT_288613 [Fimicolochytrium jonesii]
MDCVWTVMPCSPPGLNCTLPADATGSDSFEAGSFRTCDMSLIAGGIYTSGPHPMPIVVTRRGGISNSPGSLRGYQFATNAQTLRLNGPDGLHASLNLNIVRLRVDGCRCARTKRTPAHKPGHLEKAPKHPWNVGVGLHVGASGVVVADWSSDQRLTKGMYCRNVEEYYALLQMLFCCVTSIILCGNNNHEQTKPWRRSAWPFQWATGFATGWMPSCGTKW